MKRRRFLQSAALAAASLPGLSQALAAPASNMSAVPISRITNGPRFHWFGYYDKLQFDPTSRYVLGMEVDFEGRPPLETDVVRIGMIDLEQNNRWTQLGETRAWGW